MTPQATWAALLELGYLAKENPDDAVAWVTPTFQPYQSGFHQTFLQQFPDNGEALEDYLAQTCMTSLGVYDIQGRQLYNSDSRLFLKMVRNGTFLFNFRSEYGLSGQVLQSESADAGLRWSLTNMAGNIVCSWDSRGFRAENAYDNLQRPLGMYVSGGDQVDALAHWVQQTVYGETVLNAANYNLMGKPYRDYDESGLSIVEIYDLAGAPLLGKTYLRSDYKNESNWTEEARQIILNEPSYTRSSIYNAQGQLIAETLPDGSQQAYIYDINGLLQGSKQKLVDAVAEHPQEWQAVIKDIVYDAAGKRTRVAYGNDVISNYTYDACTQQLLRSFATRTIADSEEGNAVLQDIYYAYDPVGHTISTLDNNASVVFHKNQKIEPYNRYLYDPLYRIVRATGRTLPGLNKQERNGAIDASIPLPTTPNTADLQHLENYTQQFAYDFGDNLVLKKHQAASGNWRQEMTVADTNNHLDRIANGNSSGSSPSFAYDGNGNMLTLHQGSTAKVNWNYLNHISSVVTITREVHDPETGETYRLNDAEYYQYNTSGNRVRKVSERMVNGGNQIEYTEKIYLGNYQQLRTWTASGSVDSPAPTKLQSEKHTLMLKDGNAPVLITHRWIVVPSVQKNISVGDIQYRYQLCDPLDSVTMEVNEEAALLTFEQYYVYGGTAFTLARSQLEADAKELRFCGKECDALTGLYYYGARYYACWLSRWMSPDPAGPVDGPNLYEYVSSNPVKYNDPTGMGSEQHKKVVKKSGDPKKNKPLTSFKIRKAKYKRRNVTQRDLLGYKKDNKKDDKSRKSYYPTQLNPMVKKQKEGYVSSKRKVFALLKVNGMEVQMGTNGKADEKLEFYNMGIKNQKGTKINPHAEDWTLSSFRHSVSASKKNIRDFIKEKGFSDHTNNTGDNVKGKDVFSLRINYSPCLGCVNTIMGFKDYLTQQLGENGFILRLKFLRPYDLDNRLADPNSNKAKHFIEGIGMFSDAGIKVKIQSSDSAEKMHSTYNISNPNTFGTAVIKKLFPEEHEELTKSWRELGVNRKSDKAA